MTELSRRGDENSVRRDFRDAIQQAYDQGVISSSALLDGDHAFIDDRGQPALVNHKIDDAYILCLTGDYYPAVTDQVDIYLQKQPQDPYPIALSMFDLQVLCFLPRRPIRLAVLPASAVASCIPFSLGLGDRNAGLSPAPQALSKCKG